MIAQTNKVPGWRLKQSSFSRDKFCVAQPCLKPHGPASGSQLSVLVLLRLLLSFLTISCTKKETKSQWINSCLFFERSSYLPKVSLRREHTRLSQGRARGVFQSASTWKHINDLQNIISMHLLTRDLFLNHFALHKPFLAPLTDDNDCQMMHSNKNNALCSPEKWACSFFYLPDFFLSNQVKLFFFFSLSHSSLVVIVEEFSILPKMFHVMNY